MKITEIPPNAGVVDGWRLIPISPRSETLVAIGRNTPYDLITSAVYAGEHLHSPYRGDNVIQAASPTIYVRQSVAKRLMFAQSLLPSGMKLIVFDGYRSIAVQQALFDQFFVALKKLRPTYSVAQLTAETERYVSLPSNRANNPSPHSTGGAVDVAIIKDGAMLEFGTPFDHGSARSALRYFEVQGNIKSQADRTALHHRRLLYGVMKQAGFEGYEHEWWHYNAPETQMGACTAGYQVAAFGAAGRSFRQAVRERLRSYRRRPQVIDIVVSIDQISPDNQVV